MFQCCMVSYGDDALGVGSKERLDPLGPVDGIDANPRLSFTGRSRSKVADTFETGTDPGELRV